jgi:hypothetical protein
MSSMNLSIAINKTKDGEAVLTLRNSAHYS